ncbi:MAG: hypothetical protein Q4G02_03650 [bacterium]|nr:hypothetical protein [bacterium]
MKQSRTKNAREVVTFPNFSEKKQDGIIKSACDYAYEKQMKVIREYEKKTGKKLNWL